MLNRSQLVGKDEELVDQDQFKKPYSKRLKKDTRVFNTMSPQKQVEMRPSQDVDIIQLNNIIHKNEE